MGNLVSNLGDSLWTTHIVPEGVSPSEVVSFWAMTCHDVAFDGDVVFQDALVIIGGIGSPMGKESQETHFVVYSYDGGLLFDQSLGTNASCLFDNNGLITASDYSGKYRVRIVRKNGYWYCFGEGFEPKE